MALFWWGLRSFKFWVNVWGGGYWRDGEEERERLSVTFERGEEEIGFGPFSLSPGKQFAL